MNDKIRTAGKTGTAGLSCCELRLIVVLIWLLWISCHEGDFTPAVG